MEKIGDLLDSIKTRLSNPFVFSFICSWLIYNWQIPVALIWLDAQGVRDAGYTTILGLVRHYAGEDCSFIFPLYISLGITILIPLLRAAFTTINAGITRAESYLFFWISKDSKISTSRYLSLRDRYVESLKKVEQTIKDEADYELKYREAIANQGSLERDSKVLKAVGDTDFMQGRWELYYLSSKRTTFLNIMSNNVQMTEDSEGMNAIQGHLSFFFRDQTENERLFFQISQNTISKLDTFDLRKRGEGNYAGFENLKEQITLKKVV